MRGPKDLAIAAARAASEKQASDILVLDVGDLIGITDYFVIASGSSDRRVKTVAKEIERALDGLGASAVRREGRRAGEWILLDYVDLVAHVFSEEARDYYGLERLWRDAPTVSWERRVAAGG